MDDESGWAHGAAAVPALPARRAALSVEQYRFVDLARKVVGVGSVGTRC